jgi:hypothetical protein
MKRILVLISVIGITGTSRGYCQSAAVDRAAFFNDTSTIQATLVTNLDKILSSHRKKETEVPGVLIISQPDGQKITNPVSLKVRGNFRLEYCLVPPLKIKFNSKDSSVLHSLKTLELVSACKISPDFEQYLLKEYLIYKIYNLLTEKSFHTRLLRLNLQDSAGKKKPVYFYAFLLEDLKDLAKRNGYKEWGKGNIKASAVDRQQVAMVSVFEYMIGNLDWGLSPNHNVKLIVSLKDTIGGLNIIPYDFDYSGFVNAHYAVSNDEELENVKQRKYIGLPRTLTELEEVLEIYKQKKSRIYELVSHFNLLTPKSRKEITDYLDEFYDVINHSDKIKSNLMPETGH